MGSTQSKKRKETSILFNSTLNLKPSTRHPENFDLLKVCDKFKVQFKGGNNEASWIFNNQEILNAKNNSTIGEGVFGQIITIDAKFIECSKKQIDVMNTIDFLKKWSVLTLIPRGNGNDNVHNEVAALNSKNLFPFNSTFGAALAAWMNSDYYFILITRFDCDVKTFVKNAKQLCEKENKSNKLDNSIIESFAAQLIWQLKAFDKNKIAHLDWL